MKKLNRKAQVWYKGKLEPWKKIDFIEEDYLDGSLTTTTVIPGGGLVNYVYQKSS